MGTTTLGRTKTRTRAYPETALVTSSTASIMTIHIHFCLVLITSCRLRITIPLSRIPAFWPCMTPHPATQRDMHGRRPDRLDPPPALLSPGRHPNLCSYCTPEVLGGA